MDRIVPLAATTFLLAIIAGVCLVQAAEEAATPINSTLPAVLPAPAREPAAFCTDADCFAGPGACADCHQAEYAAWAKTSHAEKAFNLLRTSKNAERYVANLGLDPAELPRTPRCLPCHGAPQSNAERTAGVTCGVTCESCHNAAGGPDGWLNLHGAYGLGVARRSEESPAHRQGRVELSRNAGQYRSDDYYALAKRCYECHVLSDEDLVVQGGHHPGNLGFEMSSWLEKGVRHNFALNPHHNAVAPSLWTDPLWRVDGRPGDPANHRRLLYVVSTLVDLEISLRNRGLATHDSFSSAASTRVLGAYYRLAKVAEDESASVLKPVVERIASLEAELLMPPKEESSDRFLAAAELAAQVAKQISLAGEGERFAMADELLQTQAAPNQQR